MLFFLDDLAPGNALGNGVAIASGVAFASLILGLRLLRGGGAESAVLLGNGIAFVASAPLALRAGVPTGTDLAIFAYLGVFQLGLAYVLFARGVRTLSAVEASLLGLVEPVASAVLALLLAGERPGPFAIAGAAVILAATAWRTLAAPPQPSPGAPDTASQAASASAPAAAAAPAGGRA